jgi:hypothetical protein
VSQIESKIFAITITLGSRIDALRNDLLQAQADNETNSGNINVLDNIGLYGKDSNAKLRETITALQSGVEPLVDRVQKLDGKVADDQHQLTMVKQELATARDLAAAGILVGLAGVAVGLLLSSR